MNNIKTWQQGRFVDSSRYHRWTEEDKAKTNRDEMLRVKASPTGNAICTVSHPDHAKWIAERLNLASELEEKFKNYHS